MSNSLVFVREFYVAHYVVVTVKCLPGENWVSTMFRPDKESFDERPWVLNGILYRRGE
jgi:hypothetical protein